ncbi:MAG: HpcH/HpaI aldolase/citrate lyase family protein [Bullifex sp.]
MDKDRLRDTLLKKSPFIIGMTRFSDPRFAGLMAECGYDAVCIDDEHYPFTERQKTAIIRSVHANGASCLLRISAGTHDEVYRALDMGLDGVYAPHVSTKAEAEVILSSSKYPPMGKRGCCPITAGADYGFSSDYEKSNERIAVFMMIETKEGYENLDEILSLPGIDVIAMGPSDFSASYGKPGKASDPEIKAAMDDVYKKARAAGVICETFVSSPEDVTEGLKKGDVCLYCDSDQQMWQKVLRRYRTSEPFMVTLTTTDPAAAETAALEGADILFDYSAGAFDPARFSMLARTVHGRCCKCFVLLTGSEIDCVNYFFRLGADGAVIRESDHDTILLKDGTSRRGRVNIIGNDLELMKEGFAEYLSLIRAGIR